MYQKDMLREYILNSEIRLFSKEIKVRLSKDLAIKYDNGAYQNALLNIQNNLELLNSLNIHYPASANPILYVYIVPDNQYAQLLKIPTHFDKGMGGGKPVRCYDLDESLEEKMKFMNFPILYIVNFFLKTIQFVKALRKLCLFIH